jgi:hypothetical protein
VTEPSSKRNNTRIRRKLRPLRRLADEQPRILTVVDIESTNPRTRSTSEVCTNRTPPDFACPRTGIPLASETS